MTEHRKGDTRQLLLDAAARLISASPGQDVPLRAICDAVGVKLPTLYHFFGNREGLLEAVVNHGFDSYLSAKTSAESSGDSIADLRVGWDAHVAFGVANPGFYALMYGQVVPQQRSPAAQRPYDALLQVCLRAEAEHRLCVTAGQAADEVLAGNVGVTLLLITADEPDFELSARMREATLASITGSQPGDERTSVVESARHLLVNLPTNGLPFVTEEIALLRRWLSILSQPRDD